jgi:ferrous iron transport protein B
MKKTITIALAGNPNCGKTTIFNHMTGSHAQVGNYPGITVETKRGRASVNGTETVIVDIPGSYSLTAYSEEEVVARRVLIQDKPDAVIQVVNAGALERNLYLTVQLMELGIPVVLALNMMDEVHTKGDTINSARLAQAMSIPIVETIGRTGHGMEAALAAAIDLAKIHAGKERKPFIISYGSDLDPTLEAMTAEVERSFIQQPPQGTAVSYPARWVALKYLEGDKDIRESSFLTPACIRSLETVYRNVSEHIANTLKSYPEAIISDYRHGYVGGILKQDIIVRHINERRELSDKLDLVLTQKLFGHLIMIGVFYLIYMVAFSLGSYPINWVISFFGWLGSILDGALPDGLLKSLLVSGVIGGVGGVMAFVPLILIMFLLISFLEDTGYMARIAYILDRIFRVFGLHGLSIMPYIISGGIAGGCAVPGVMATRTLRSPKEKLATMLTLPFMICGAKIPVFILFVGIFFAEEYRATVMLCISLIGWGLALLAARVLRSTIITGPATPFVMELPPYRLPTLRGLLTHTWERGWQYLKKAGTIILAIAILVWATMTFPSLPENVNSSYEQRIAVLQEQVDLAEKIPDGGALKPVVDGQASSEKTALMEARNMLDEIKNEQSAAALRYSIAGRIGMAIEPISSLAGFDWRTSIALVGGLAAKEVLVSTLGTAYSLGEVNPEETGSLADKIRADTDTWSFANALSLMIFVLIYAPCAVLLAAMRAETGTWRWPIFSLVGNTFLAYCIAVLVFHISKTIL